MPNRARSAFKLIAQPDRYYFILTGNVPKSDNFWVIERWTPISPDRMDLTVTFKDEERFTAPVSETLQFRRNPQGETSPQPMTCIPGVGQRYQPNPETGELELSGPGMVPLELAED